ncbi:MAG: phosphoglucosamine mutase, partial [Halobacteria archaeon]|nr:phosphoglucosamine mutase [Halobacteria archaeon]
PHVLRRLGCDVLTINSQYDGRFPGRLPEPTDENLGDLKNAVVSTDADLGVAHDGDADRTAAVDRDGEFVEPDRLLAMLAEHEGTDEVVAPLNTSMVVDSVVDVIRTKVGDVYVSEKLKKTDGVFGGEPSNSWVFAEETLCPDGVLAAAKICEMASEEAITDRLDGLSDYEVRRTSHGCENAMKEDVMRRVEESVSEEFGEYTDVDGVRVETGEGWFLIRPSGTEPLIRVTAEAETEESADSLLEEAEEVLKEALR